MLQENCVVSVGGDSKVRNPQLAVNAFKNLVNDSLALVRENLRAAILRRIVDPSPEGKRKMATTITAEMTANSKAAVSESSILKSQNCGSRRGTNLSSEAN